MVSGHGVGGGDKVRTAASRRRRRRRRHGCVHALPEPVQAGFVRQVEVAASWEIGVGDEGKEQKGSIWMFLP